MTRRPRITDESVLTRWMGMEITRINDSIVAVRRSLAELLAEELEQHGTAEARARARRSWPPFGARAMRGAR